MPVDAGESRDETRFIADHWAGIWAREGGPARALADVGFRPSGKGLMLRRQDRDARG